MSYAPQPPGPYGPGGTPPHQFGPEQQRPVPPPGMWAPPPPPPRPSRGPMLFGVLTAVGALAVAATALVLSGVVGDDDEPAAIGADPTADATVTETPFSPSSAPSEPATTEPLTAAAFEDLPNLCDVIEPRVAEYMTIDPDGTESDFFLGDRTCDMVGQFTDHFERPGVYVTQTVAEDDPVGGVVEFEFQREVIAGGCQTSEDAAGEWEASVYYQGTAEQGCVILGDSYKLNAASGNMFVSVEVWFGSAGQANGDEQQVVADIAALVREAAAV